MRQNVVLSIAMLGILLVVGCKAKADDAAVLTNIKSQMFSDPQLKDADLQVTSKGGEVTLSGTVPSDAAHLEAYKIASQTAGVTKVDDQVTVETAQVPPAEVAPSPEPVPAPEKPRKTHASMHESAMHTDPPAPVAAATAPVQNSAPPPQPVAAAAPAPPPPPPAPQPRQVEVPAGSTMTIRMIDGVDSSVNHPGEIFHSSLEAPLVVGDEVVVSKGADVYVRLVSASSAGKMTGKSELHLELIKMEYQGQSYPLVSSTYSQSGASRGKDTAKKVGGGAVLGTLIGAIAGGGKGAAIGAGVGAAGGTVYQAATHGQQVRIPSETKLDFTLDQPVTVTVMPHKSAATE